MEQEFEQRRAVQPVIKFRALHKVGSARAFDGGIHLGRIQMEFVRQAQVRRPSAFLQRKLEQHNKIERPQHAFIIGLFIQYSNKMNIGQPVHA
jgi:hypothetical protein